MRRQEMLEALYAEACHALEAHAISCRAVGHHPLCEEDCRLVALALLADAAQRLANAAEGIAAREVTV